MSIHKQDGGYQVKWREGGRQRSRTFDRKGDAVAFEVDVKRRQQLGPLASAVMESKMTLAEFVREEWWPRYAVPNLAPDTRRRYLEVWEHDLRQRLGGYELRKISPGMVENVRDELAHAGVMRELKGQPRVPAADAIRQAREQASGQLRLVAR